MNYEKIYNALVYKRKAVEPLPDDAICEKHHIIPRSIRPDLEFEQSNIVRLTLREHFICHQLLEKIYAQKFGINSKEHQKMVVALFGLSNYQRYGKMLTARQYESLKLKYRENIGEVLRRAWKNYPKEKMDKLRAKRKINSSGSRNPMFGRSWKEGKTEEEILQHRIKTSIGLKNRTEEQKRMASQKMREAYMRKTIEQKQETNRKRIASRKKFYDAHPEILEDRNAKIGEARLGMRKLFKEGEPPVWVRAKDIQTYLDNGWKYSLHEPDKTNSAYGRRWMHIKGSCRKEDRVFVKQEDIEHYLKLGYVLGIVDNPQPRHKNQDGVLTITLPYKKETKSGDIAKITVE